jgi:hypothetical protein
MSAIIETFFTPKPFSGLTSSIGINQFINCSYSLKDVDIMKVKSICAATSILVLMLVSVSFADIGRNTDPDQHRKDITGAVLVGTNVLASAYFLDKLSETPENSLFNYLGIAWGAGSVVVAYADETSFRYGVGIAGVLTIVLATIGLSNSGGEKYSDSFDLSQRRRRMIAPVVIDERVGLMFRTTF